MSQAGVRERDHVFRNSFDSVYLSALLKKQDLETLKYSHSLGFSRPPQSMFLEGQFYHLGDHRVKLLLLLDLGHPATDFRTPPDFHFPNYWAHPKEGNALSHK